MEILSLIDEVEEKCHWIKIFLNIDENNFAQLCYEPIICPEIQSLPLTLNPMENLNIPVIGFFDNSSVICLSIEGKSYEFLDSWNGKLIF